ncbi:MAG TPA: PAS domain-containing protein [Acidimicrobiia bacterium]
MTFDDIQHDVLDALDEGLVVQDTSGEIVYANPAAERILGFPASELLGLTSKDPRWEAVDVHGVPLPGDEHPIVVARVTGRPVRDFLMGFRRSDSERRWVEINAMPLVDDPGDPPVGSVAMFRDVTADLAAKQALRVSEERFRTAVETMQDGFMIWRAVRDDDDRIVDFVCEFANEAVGAAQYRPTDLIGRRLREIDPNLSDEHFARYAAVVEQGDGNRMHVPWPEGSRVRTFDVSVVRMGDGVAVSYRDVTRQIEHQHELRESEEQTRRFLEAIPIGIAVVAPGRVVFINETARAILGRDISTDVRGAGLVDYFDVRRAGTGEPYPYEELPLYRAMFEGETCGADDVVLVREGRHIPVETYAAPVRDSEGEVRWALTLINDITERRMRAGRGAIDPAATVRLAKTPDAARDATSLTQREHEVLLLLADGLSSREIAEQLFISLNTARNHVQRLIAKLGAHSRLEAVAVARRAGLVDTTAPH